MNAHLRDEELIDQAFELVEERDAARVAQHLAACADCRERQARLCARLGQLEALQADVEAPQPLISDTLRRIRLDTPAKSIWPPWLVFAAGAAAAAIAFVAVPALWTFTHPARPGTTAALQHPAEEGYVVDLAQSEPPLEEVRPLPEAPAPTAVTFTEEVASIAHSVADVPPAPHPVNPPGPALNVASVTSDARIAVRAPERGIAPAPGTAGPGRPPFRSPTNLAHQPANGNGRKLVQPAVAIGSPGPAVLVYRVLAQDHVGRIGSPDRVDVAQRADRLTLSNSAARALTVRILGLDSTTQDVFLAPGLQTNLVLQGVPVRPPSHTD